MDDINRLKLTDDPLTNIHIMIPLLDSEARKAVSYLLYGYFIGEQLGKTNGSSKDLMQEADRSKELQGA